MRFLQGISVAAIATSGYALVYEKFGENEGARCIALLGGITIMGPALGPPIGSLILYVADWRMIFTALGLLAVIATTLTYVALKKSFHTPN